MSRLRAEARRHWGNLQPFGKACAAAVVCVLLTAALVGMARESAPSSPPAAVPAPTPLAAILPPADLAALLRGGDVARVVEGERGERSSASALPLTTLAEDVSVPVAASSAAGHASAPRWEPGLWGEQLTPAEVYGLAVDVTGDHGWASFASRCFTGGGENRGYVGAVSPVNRNGTQDLGLGQSNTRTLAALGFDADRVLEDPHYAMEALHATFEAQGYGAWFGCAPGGGQ